MQKRKLGRTGLNVSPIAVGGAALTYFQASTGWDPMPGEDAPVCSVHFRPAMAHELGTVRGG